MSRVGVRTLPSPRQQCDRRHREGLMLSSSYYRAACSNVNLYHHAHAPPSLRAIQASVETNEKGTKAWPVGTFFTGKRVHRVVWTRNLHETADL